MYAYVEKAIGNMGGWASCFVCGKIDPNNVSWCYECRQKVLINAGALPPFPQKELFYTNEPIIEGNRYSWINLVRGWNKADLKLLFGIERADLDELYADPYIRARKMSRVRKGEFMLRRAQAKFEGDVMVRVEFEGEVKTKTKENGEEVQVPVSKIASLLWDD